MASQSDAVSDFGDFAVHRPESETALETKALLMQAFVIFPLDCDLESRTRVAQFDVSQKLDRSGKKNFAGDMFSSVLTRLIMNA